MNEEETVSAATWRVALAASNVREVIERHRAGVLGVAAIEETLVPKVDVFLPAVAALRAFSNLRKVSEPSRNQAIEALHRRTLFWLTYVRLDAPGYVAGDLTGQHKGGKLVIDRARGVIEFAQRRMEGHEPSLYAAALLAELTPVFERGLQEHTGSEQSDMELQRLQTDVRRSMVPVHRGLVPLRILLRNALGSTHKDVRALSVDAPTKGRKKAPPKAA